MGSASVELVADFFGGWVDRDFWLLISSYLSQGVPLESSPNYAAESRSWKSAGLFALDIQSAICVAHAVKDLRDIFVYDLMAKLRSDPLHAKRAQQAVDNVRNVKRRYSDGKAERGDVARALSSVVTACGFNYGLLLPHIFPKYPTTEPLSLIPRPFMFVMTTLAANSTLTLRAGRQVGKCADGDSEVETESHGTMTLRQVFAAGINTGARSSPSIRLPIDSA